MDLLLDTHIWIWSVLEPRRLSGRVSRELTKPQNQLWLSPVSIWELSLLCRKGRVQLDEEVEVWVSTTLSTLQLRDAPLTAEVALELLRLRLPQGDPADHFMAATAKAFGLTLVTADERLLHVPGVAVMGNR